MEPWNVTLRNLGTWRCETLERGTVERWNIELLNLGTWRYGTLERGAMKPWKGIAVEPWNTLRNIGTWPYGTWRYGTMSYGAMELWNVALWNRLGTWCFTGRFWKASCTKSGSQLLTHIHTHTQTPPSHTHTHTHARTRARTQAHTHIQHKTTPPFKNFFFF